ncbi:hypothetical protein EDB87DRAFT_1559244, partial [Lactarius vividus]
IKYVLPWGRHHFSVSDMTDSYTVFLNLHHSCSVPHFCTCSAFAYAVLISILGCFRCKHVLGTLVPECLSEHVMCEVGKDEFVIFT